MALTIATVAGADHVAGNKRVKVRTVTFDSSYPTGGEPLTAADVGLKKLTQVIPHGPARNTAGTLAVNVAYDYTNSKLFAYETAGTVATPHAEVGNTESLDTYAVRVTFVGH